jgi:hypothetical protein
MAPTNFGFNLSSMLMLGQQFVTLAFQLGPKFYDSSGSVPEPNKVCSAFWCILVTEFSDFIAMH